MNRRELLLLLGGTLTAARAVGAQQKAMPVIGYLDSGSADRSQVSAFRAGLGEAGYEEGRNVTIEYRWADGQYDRLPTLAGDLVRRQVAVIAASSTPAALAAKGATATIPIVFTTGNDPVAVGLVASLSRPGGNLTGVTRINLQLGPKRLELLHELVPTATAIGLLVNPTNPNAETLPKDVKAAADILGLKIQMLQARTDTDLVSVFGALGRLRAGGLLIGPDPFFNMRIERLAALAIDHAVPAIYQYRAFVAAGGLASYSASLSDSHRRVGVYTGRILGGAKPADLPVEQPTTFELVVNLKTAKELGLTVPPSILARADEVIE